MKYSILLLLCLWGSITTLYAQCDTISVGVKSDGTELKAAAFSFHRYIESFTLSPDGKKLLITSPDWDKYPKSLKNKGQFALYNLHTMRKEWEWEMDFPYTKVNYTRWGILKNRFAKLSLIDTVTMEPLWKLTLSPAYLDDSLGIVLGYGNNQKKLKAIQMKDGKLLWEAKIGHKYGWTQFYPLTPEEVLIVGDRVERLNLLTGQHSTYEAKTGIIDKKMIAGMVMLGVVAGAMGAMAGSMVAPGGSVVVPYCFPVPSAEVISGMTSNVIQTDSCFYLADRNKVACLDLQLTPKWECELPDKASSSYLRMEDDVLHLVNTGYGVKGGINKVKVGKAFVAGFRVSTGEQLYWNYLPEKEDRIIECAYAEDKTYMLMPEGLAYRNVGDSVLNVARWDTEKRGKLEGMINYTVYECDSLSGGFLPVEYNETRLPVFTEQGRLYVVDKNLCVYHEYGAESLYFPCADMGDYVCIYNKDDFRLIHKLGMPISSLSVGWKQGMMTDTQLILLDNQNRLLFIDKKDLLE